jgi:hypothetical protein
MITPNNPMFNSLFSGIFSQSNWADGIANLRRGFARPQQIIQAMNPSGPIAVTDPEGRLLTAFKPKQEVVQQIASTTQSGANLIITWVDPSYDSFRNKFIVRDGLNNQAYVMSHSAGTITIAPAPGTPTLTAGTHFVVNDFVTTLSSAAGNHNSKGVEGLYETLDYRVNYSAITRESQQMSSREKFNEYTVTTNGVETAYGWADSEMFMVERWARQDVYDFLFSDPGQANGLEGTYNRFEGVRAAIKNQGGRFNPAPTLWSQTDFEGDLDWMAQNDPAQEQDFLCVLGRRAWARISSFYQGDIGFTQSRMVINGNELNFDITKLTINGVTVKFMVWGAFDDATKFPKISSVAGAGLQMSNTYCLLNLAPLPNKNGGVIPCVRPFYFANSLITGGAEVLYRYLPGMIGAGPGNSTGGPTMGGSQMAGSSTMGMGWEIAKDGGYDIAGDACAWRELTA